LISRYKTFLVNFFKVFYPMLTYSLAIYIVNENKYFFVHADYYYIVFSLILLRSFYGLKLKFFSMSYRLASIEELLVIALTILAGTISVFIMIFLFRLEYSIRILFIELQLSVFLISFIHLYYRIIKIIKYHLDPVKRTNILIIGDGIKASSLIKEIKHLKDVEYKIVGLLSLDNNRNDKVSNIIHGIKIFKRISDLKYLIRSFEINEIIIALDYLDPIIIDQVVANTMEQDLDIKILPSTFSDNDDYKLEKLREINLSDLLGRDEIKIDSDKISYFINNHVVVVTGAAGSIGSELCRQIVSYGPKKLILIDHAETPLFEIDSELINKNDSKNHKIYLADIRDKDRMNEIFKREKPKIVFHAAAYKHVPLIETNITEAISVNIKGTKILADLSVEYGVKKFVLISTDKAVNPTNVMGCSKRIAELYVQSLNHISETEFITTRFGNVLGSNGSVVPIFKKQIEKGGPITVTHPEVTRYFMLINEAVSLVLQAGSMGNGGEIFLFDMGKPVEIKILAEKLIKLMGYQVNKDIKIEYTGLRPGEKIYEELLVKGEDNIKTDHKKILIAKSIVNDRFLISEQIDQLITNKYFMGDEEKITFLKSIVNEYEPNRLKLAK
jgi:FlaA1/EpsC-like NDP-sugar epimerase